LDLFHPEDPFLFFPPFTPFPKFGNVVVFNLVYFGFITSSPLNPDSLPLSLDAGRPCLFLPLGESR